MELLSTTASINSACQALIPLSLSHIHTRLSYPSRPVPSCPVSSSHPVCLKGRLVGDIKRCGVIHRSVYEMWRGTIEVERLYSLSLSLLLSLFPTPFFPRDLRCPTNMKSHFKIMSVELPFFVFLIYWLASFHLRIMLTNSRSWSLSSLRWSIDSAWFTQSS